MALADRILVQVVAQLKPSRCGISDYALLLAQELKATFNVESIFLVVNSLEKSAVPFQSIHCHLNELSETCRGLVGNRQAGLLLHYSGYGYSRDGAPAELPNVLSDLRTLEGLRVGVYFHELFASGMPWRKAFWFKRRQQQVVRDVSSQCDFIATNLERHADWLRKNVLESKAVQFRQMPVFSNVGETSRSDNTVPRRPILVVFGLRETRRRSYERLASMSKTLRHLKIEEIVDVGPEFDSPTQVCGIKVSHKGIMDSTELAYLLKTSRFGFVPHPSFCLAKSGVFAGLCANGTIPLLGTQFARQIDGLTDGVHLLTDKSAPTVRTDVFDQLSSQVTGWYEEHRIAAHARMYADALIRS